MKKKCETILIFPYRISFANKSREGGISSTFNKQMSCFDHSWTKHFALTFRDDCSCWVFQIQCQNLEYNILKKIQFQMKHFNLSANTCVFFHSREQCDFFRSHSQQVWRQIPKPCTAQWCCPAFLLKECPWNVWGSAWLHRQCFGQSNISYGIGRFRTQTWKSGFHCANRTKWKPHDFLSSPWIFNSRDFYRECLGI